MANHGTRCGHSSGASSRAAMTPLTKEKLEFALPQMLKAMTRLGKSLQNPTVRTYIHRNHHTSHIRLRLFPSSSQVRGGWDGQDHLFFHERYTHGEYGITVHFTEPNCCCFQDQHAYKEDNEYRIIYSL